MLEALSSAVASDPLVTAGVGDVETLYRSLSKPLEQMVRRDVRAPDPVIEDACQFAWARLVHHRERVQRDCAFSWLIKTAVHEALKHLRRRRRELSLEAIREDTPNSMIIPGTPAFAEVLEFRERLDELRCLPERQQRLLWLHGFGLNYYEMSLHEGCTRRTIERQLLRAKQQVRTQKP